MVSQLIYKVTLLLLDFLLLMLMFSFSLLPGLLNKPYLIILIVLFIKKSSKILIKDR
jgi:hypothetical protein